MMAPQRGRVGDATQDKDDDHNSTADYANDMYHNMIDTTIHNNVLGRLTLFISYNSVIMTMDVRRSRSHCAPDC